MSGDVSVLSATGGVAGTVAGRSFYDAGQVNVKSRGRIDLRMSVPMRSLTVTGGPGPVTVELPGAGPTRSRPMRSRPGAATSGCRPTRQRRTS